MAVEMIRKLICDVGERHDGTHTLSFAVSGQTYEVDLCDKHGKEFDKDMTRWSASGRRAQPQRRTRGPNKTSATRTGDSENARAWAKLTGNFRVQDSGRISPTVLKAWRDAGSPAA